MGIGAVDTGMWLFDSTWIFASMIALSPLDPQEVCFQTAGYQWITMDNSHLGIASWKTWKGFLKMSYSTFTLSLTIQPLERRLLLCTLFESQCADAKQQTC